MMNSNEQNRMLELLDTYSLWGKKAALTRQEKKKYISRKCHGEIKNIMLDLEKITLNVREIALRAGAFLRNERSGFDRSKVEKKNAHDYVSYVDKESERRIVAQLRELLPEAGFIAEEGSAAYSDETYCWVVDPLDGTTNYSSRQCSLLCKYCLA